MAGQRRIGIAGDTQQAGARGFPEPVEPALHRRVVDDLRLHCLDPGAHLRIVLEIMRERHQPFLALARKGDRIVGHVVDHAVEPADDLVRQRFVEAGPAHDRSGAVMDHRPDHVFIGAEHLGRPADDAV